MLFAATAFLSQLQIRKAALQRRNQLSSYKTDLSALVQLPIRHKFAVAKTTRAVRVSTPLFGAAKTGGIFTAAKLINRCKTASLFPAEKVKLTLQNVRRHRFVAANTYFETTKFCSCKLRIVVARVSDTASHLCFLSLRRWQS